MIIFATSQVAKSANHPAAKIHQTFEPSSISQPPKRGGQQQRLLSGRRIHTIGIGGSSSSTAGGTKKRARSLAAPAGKSTSPPLPAASSRTTSLFSSRSSLSFDPSICAPAARCPLPAARTSAHCRLVTGCSIIITFSSFRQPTISCESGAARFLYIVALSHRRRRCFPLGSRLFLHQLCARQLGRSGSPALTRPSAASSSALAGPGCHVPGHNHGAEINQRHGKRLD